MNRPGGHSGTATIAGFASALLCLWGIGGCEILKGDDADGRPLTSTGGSPAGSVGTGGSIPPSPAGSGGHAAGSAGSGGGAGSAGSAGTAGSGGSAADPFAAARQACVDKINALRASEGKPPYLRWTDAEACSDAEAKSDSMTKKAHGAFGMCKESAQDECPGWPNDVNKIITGCLQDMWNEGPGTFADHGHYLNMSSTKYKSVACGFFVTADKKMWAVQNFK